MQPKLVFRLIKVERIIKMNDNAIEINQKAAFGSETTQIALQQKITNNTTNKTYIGISPQEVSKQMIDIFLDNFPKLQQLAAEKAVERVNELWDEILKKIETHQITNFTPFSEPDMQYSLFEVEKDYARFGTKELLSTLSALVIRRIQYDGDFFLKVVADKALSVVNFLSSAQLDLMSLLFFCKHVKISGIKSLDDLEGHLKFISKIFSKADINAISFLETMGCTTIFLVDLDQHYASAYGLNQQDVHTIIPPKILELDGDYGLSYVGILLAIVNAEAKTKYRFDPKIWITG